VLESLAVTATPQSRRPTRVAPGRLLAALVATLAALGGASCRREPPDLPRGHVAWLDGAGTTHLGLRATPYGFRVLDGNGDAWGRLERLPGEVRLTGSGRQPVVARIEPDAVVVRDSTGRVLHRVVTQRTGLAVLDAAGTPVGGIREQRDTVLALAAGGRPVGTVRTSGGVLVLRGHDGLVTGTLLGAPDPGGAAFLLLDQLPLEERVALFVLHLAGKR
jgi:hypothetical protein